MATLVLIQSSQACLEFTAYDINPNVEGRQCIDTMAITGEGGYPFLRSFEEKNK